MKRLLLLAVGVVMLAACAPKIARFQMQETTAVDIKTGVVWMKHANLPGQPLPWRADDNVYAFIQNLNKTHFAGYADWRVPTREEMAVLISYAKKEGHFQAEKMESWPYQVLRRLGFEDVRDYGYWTATRESETEIFVADLATGKVEARPENKTYYLWPVRGGR